MLTRKPCKWCGSVWHSKNKCPQREISPFKPVYTSKGTNSPLSIENPSERPKLAYKGNSERSQLIGWADKFFSLYIRTRGGDGWKNSCYTCGVRQTHAELQCGHFISRRYSNVRWNEMNCHPQCNECNVEKKGNLEVYRRNLVREYGETAVQMLQALAYIDHKVTIVDLKEIIDKYKGVVF